jgi:hypothetical protein
MRPKLTVPAQIKDMSDAGIAFDVITKADAMRFLENNTYYFKIKAYAKNYEKYNSGDKNGQYINLDFAYLQDLSIIDAHLRKHILKISLDIEHFLKVKMLSDFQKVDEDGYDIIQELFSLQPDLSAAIVEKSNTSTCNKLIQKYKNEWAIWNIVEVMSFGQFTNLYGLFYQRNKFKDTYVNMLLPVKMIRNAAAHNNCLINCLKPPFARNITPCHELKYELSQYVKLSQNALDKKLAHPTIHDFAALLYTYHRVVPATTRERTYNDMKEFFSNRMLKHSDYYVKNEILKSCYEFVAKIVNYYN